jgi:hypothetical protein
MIKILTGGLVLAVLLATALLSQAACAWVLWMQLSWTLRGQLQRDEKYLRSSASTEYRCLPDTVDPRTPPKP